MDIQIKRYIKKEFYKDKGLPARLLDSVFLKIMIFLGLFILFFAMRTGVLRAIVLAATITTSSGILKFVFNKTRFMSFSKKRIEQARNDCMLERLVLLDSKHRKELSRRVMLNYLEIGQSELKPAKGGYVYKKTFCYFFGNHPKYPVNVEQIAYVCRNMRSLDMESSLLISASGFDKDARAMAVRRSVSSEIIEEEKLINLLGKTMLCPTEEETYEYLAGEIEEQRITKEKLKDAFFDADKGKAFALVALVLAIWPLFGKFNIAYPIAAAICAALAVYGFLRSYKKKNIS